MTSAPRGWDQPARSDQSLPRTWHLADRVCMGDPEHQQLSTFVGPDGEQLLMLIDSDHSCEDCPLPAPPDHERLGPLPHAVAVRFPHLERGQRRRCGAPTAYGTPCRQYPQYGQAGCWQHRGGGGHG